MRFMVLSVCLMMVLTGCGVEWFPEGNLAASVSITSTTLADAPTGVSYSQTLTASGGTAPYTWTVLSGSLPAGLSLSAGGIISGIPTEPTPIPATTPVYTFSVQVKDSATTPATVTKSLSISTPITKKDTTGKVYASILSFDVSRGVVVSVTNTDSVDHDVQVVVENVDTVTGINTELIMTPVTVSAGATATITNASFTTALIYNWRIKSITVTR